VREAGCGNEGRGDAGYDEGWGAGFLIESMDSGELAERIIMLSDPGTVLGVRAGCKKKDGERI